MSQRKRSQSTAQAPPLKDRWAKQVLKVETMQDLLESRVPFTWHLAGLVVKAISSVLVMFFNFTSPVIILIILDVVLVLVHSISHYRDKRQRTQSVKRSPGLGKRKEVRSEDLPAQTRNRSGAVFIKKKPGSDGCSSGDSSTIHVAGTSTTRCKPGCFPKPLQDVMPWQDADASRFRVRAGPDYKKNSFKAPSGESLYELLGVDVLRCSKDRLCNIGSHPEFSLPAHRPGVDPAMSDMRKAEVPRLFIVNAQIPDKSPSLMGGKKNKAEDLGYSLVFYFSVKKQVVEKLLESRDMCSPAVKLLYKYVHEHDTNPDIRRRFKAIGMADVKDIGIPGVGPMIDKFNGKPAIINKVAEIYSSGNDWDWFEVDISIFDFPFLAQKALYALKDRVAEIGLRAGFVFQGESDEELPENLLGGAELVRLT